MNPQLKEAGLLKKLFLKFSYWKIFKAIKLKEAGLLKEFFFFFKFSYWKIFKKWANVA